MEQKMTETELRSSLYFTDPEIRTKIDDLLRENASLECTLGKESTHKEKSKVKVKQDRLFNKIKELDEKFYEVIVTEEDR